MSNDTLIQFGLTKKEVKIYLALLELGKATGQQIAKKAELPRSTAYSVIDTLLSQNLVFPVQEGNINQYLAEDPQKIINLSEQTTRTLKSVLPGLKNLYASAKSRPKIKYYESLSGIKKMYENILRQKGLKEYLIFAAEQSWVAMDESWINDFKKRRASAKIKTRLISEDSPIAHQRQRDGGKFLSEVRILKNSPLEDWVAGVYIFHNKVIFIEYKKDLIAVEVFSLGIAKMLKMMFETIWKTLPEPKNN